MSDNKILNIDWYVLEVAGRDEQLRVLENHSTVNKLAELLDFPEVNRSLDGTILIGRNALEIGPLYPSRESRLSPLVADLQNLGLAFDLFANVRDYQNRVFGKATLHWRPGLTHPVIVLDYSQMVGYEPQLYRETQQAVKEWFPGWQVMSARDELHLESLVQVQTRLNSAGAIEREPEGVGIGR